MADLSTEFKGFLDKVADKIKDLVTIDVVTLTGELNLDVTPAGGASKIDPTELFKNLEATPGGKLSVVALTHVEIDMDVTNFGSSAPSTALLTLHQESVKNAVEARKAVIEMIEGLLKIA